MALTKITTSVVAVNSLTAANIADNSIDATKIANNQILARHIAADALSDQIADNSITAGMIPNATALTLDGGVTIDNITIDGTEIDLSSGNLTIDVAGEIKLDSDDGVWRFQDNGGSLIELSTGSGSSPTFYSAVSDADIVFRGNDGGSAITALTLDMSEAGRAQFKSHVLLDTAGAYVQVAGSSSNYWGIGSTGGENAPGTASTTLAFHRWNGSAWNNAVEIDTNGIITPDTGTGGIKLGGAAAANLLDHYEEGTWTPAMVTTGGVTTSSSNMYGIFTRIGRVVFIHAKIEVTLSSLPGQTVSISGLPFAAKDSSDSNQRAVIAIGGDAVNTGGNTPKAHFRTNGSQLDGIYLDASNNTAYWTYNTMDSTAFQMNVHGHYTI